ncbi:hypothetical protein HYW76_04295 [Candidatus Pacearchaeota archaeon]|nr:hypothetical protein [Candidatus Pacearchaeota archaeon]
MKRGKTGQIQISFGMIFSIILIIAVIAVAFYAITKFLCVKKSAEVGLFKEELQNEINRARGGAETSETFDGNLPVSIKKVCFFDSSKPAIGKDKELEKELKKYMESNLFFYPPKSCQYPKGLSISYINLDEITKENNPYCFSNLNGKVSIKITGYYGNPVMLSYG